MLTPVNDHTAVAAGHYGDLLGDARGSLSFSSWCLYHPPQPYTTNAAFNDLWNHAAVTRRPHADISTVTGCPSWLQRRFFGLAAKRFLLGRPWWPSLYVAALATR